MHGSDPLSTDYQLVKLNDASTALDGSITPALEEAAEIADSMNAFLIYNAICALIPK